MDSPPTLGQRLPRPSRLIYVQEAERSSIEYPRHIIASTNAKGKGRAFDSEERRNDVQGSCRALAMPGEPAKNLLQHIFINSKNEGLIAKQYVLNDDQDGTDRSAHHLTYMYDDADDGVNADEDLGRLIANNDQLIRMLDEELQLEILLSTRNAARITPGMIGNDKVRTGKQKLSREPTTSSALPNLAVLDIVAPLREPVAAASFEHDAYVALAERLSGTEALHRKADLLSCRHVVGQDAQVSQERLAQSLSHIADGKRKTRPVQSSHSS